MRFLVLGLDVDIGRLSGDSVHLKELAANLTKIGHEVSVILGGSPETEALPAGFYYLKGKRVWSVIREAHRIARAVKPDVIYERRLSPKVGYSVSRLLGVPYFVEVNGIPEAERSILAGRRYEPSWFQIQARRNLLSRAKAVVAVSGSLRDVLVTSYRLDRSKVHVVPNGVDTELFRPMERAACRHELGLERDELILGFVGSLVPWQGVDIMIRTVSELRKARRSIRGVIVGDGPDRQRLEALVEAEALRGQVTFTGSVPYREVPRYIGSFDVAVSLKPPMLPGSPLKVREYMSCARPVIASRGTQYDFAIVEEAGGGVLVDSTNIREVATAVGELLSDGARRTEMGVRGRDYAVKHCSWRLTAERVAAACRG